VNTCARCLGTVIPNERGVLTLVGEPFFPTFEHEHTLITARVAA